MPSLDNQKNRPGRLSYAVKVTFWRSYFNFSFVCSGCDQIFFSSHAIPTESAGILFDKRDRKIVPSSRHLSKDFQTTTSVLKLLMLACTQLCVYPSPDVSFGRIYHEILCLTIFW